MAERPDRYLTCQDLAEILRVKPKTIQNRLAMVSERPELLPARSYPPGVHGARWSPRVVAEWQARYDPETPFASPAKRRPGRPTKAEQIRTRLAQNGAKVTGIGGS